MTENNKTGNNSMKAVPAEGGMFLYEKPEYLSPKTHADIGWRTPSQPYAFARAVNSIPLVASEILCFQRKVLFGKKLNRPLNHQEQEDFN